jgi:hypothetical protein
MHTRTLLPATALIALVAAGPLAWAQDSHDSSATRDDTTARSQATDNNAGSNAVAMASGQSHTICNDRSSTVACSVKSIPHEPDSAPVNPAIQAPSPKQ